MSLSDHDLARLRRSIALARKGLFGVEPNPAVGCVLDRDGRVVGEGWHRAYGGPHAEVAALAAAGPDARGATAYVSLEPCSRTGKTGPCTDALLEAGVRRVVYAASDPNEGEHGATVLQERGVDVEGPALAQEAAASLAAFERARSRDRPWVVLKWAMSADGRIAAAPGRGGRISGARAQAFVHDLRAHADAVAVGVKTVLADDPRLTCRFEGGVPDGRRQPLRVVFDSRLRTPALSRLVRSAGEVPLLLFGAAFHPDRRRELEGAGVELVERPGGDGRVDLRAALRTLRERGVARLLVEGGAEIHGALLRQGLADQVTAIVAPVPLGHESAPAAVTGTDVTDVDLAPRLEEVTWRRLGDDLVLQGYVPGSGTRAGTGSVT